MNFKKFFFLTVFIQFWFSYSQILAGINVVVQVDDLIITNHDIKKEINYLNILNPNYEKLNNDQKFKIAKDYLIDQAIKKKEIEIFIKDLNDERIINDYLNRIYSKLNLKSEEEFKKLLSSKTGYSLLEVKEKIKIDLLWNDFIYNKYRDQVIVDKNEILKKVNNTQEKMIKMYLISEILFQKKREVTLQQTLDEIKMSINQIGFSNTANIYSISESSKFGGKVGWVSELSLSKNINDKIKNLKKDEYSDLIKIGNNYLILKIEDTKYDRNSIDKEQEIQRLINLEKNRQLNQFSQIFFNKTKINYSINER